MPASRLQIGVLAIAAIIAIAAVVIQLHDELGEPEEPARGRRRSPKRQAGPTIGVADPALSVGARAEAARPTKVLNRSA